MRYNFSEKQVGLAGMASHRPDDLMIVAFLVQTLAGANANGPVGGSGGTCTSRNVLLCDGELDTSVSPTPTPKRKVHLALEEDSDRTPKCDGHGHKIADSLLGSPTESGMSSGRPTCVLGAIGASSTPRPTLRPSSRRRKLFVATDADVPWLPSDAAAFLGDAGQWFQRVQWSMSTLLPRIWVAWKVQLPRSRQSELWVVVA